MKKIDKNTNMGLVIGMCIGSSIGTSWGMIFDKSIIGASIGLSIGFLIGLIIGAHKDNKVNKQIKEKGYSIQTIELNNKNKVYTITIVDKSGVEKVINITKSQMKTEKFSIGDIVYLNNKGLIEQAYAKYNR